LSGIWHGDEASRRAAREAIVTNSSRLTAHCSRLLSLASRTKPHINVISAPLRRRPRNRTVTFCGNRLAGSIIKSLLEEARKPVVKWDGSTGHPSSIITGPTTHNPPVVRCFYVSSRLRPSHCHRKFCGRRLEWRFENTRI